MSIRSTDNYNDELLSPPPHAHRHHPYQSSRTYFNIQTAFTHHISSLEARAYHSIAQLQRHYLRERFARLFESDQIDHRSNIHQLQTSFTNQDYDAIVWFLVLQENFGYLPIPADFNSASYEVTHLTEEPEDDDNQTFQVHPPSDNSTPDYSPAPSPAETAATPSPLPPSTDEVVYPQNTNPEPRQTTPWTQQPIRYTPARPTRLLPNLPEQFPSYPSASSLIPPPVRSTGFTFSARPFRRSSDPKV